ncbi:MAG: hypothetical protein ACXW3S_13180 [Rhodoplanes sp.]
MDQQYAGVDAYAHLTGDVKVPIPGWKVTLVRKVPQGINPRILLLDVQAAPPKEPVIQVIQVIPLRYEESPPQNDYSQVTVLDGSDSVTVDVTITH